MQIFFKGSSEVAYQDYEYSCDHCRTDNSEKHVCGYCLKNIDEKECEENRGKCAECVAELNEMGAV